MSTAPKKNSTTCVLSPKGQQQSFPHGWHSAVPSHTFSCPTVQHQLQLCHNLNSEEDKLNEIMPANQEQQVRQRLLQQAQQYRLYQQQLLQFQINQQLLHSQSPLHPELMQYPSPTIPPHQQHQFGGIHQSALLPFQSTPTPESYLQTQCASNLWNYIWPDGNFNCSNALSSKSVPYFQPSNNGQSMGAIPFVHYNFAVPQLTTNSDNLVQLGVANDPRFSSLYPTHMKGQFFFPQDNQLPLIYQHSTSRHPHRGITLKPPLLEDTAQPSGGRAGDNCKNVETQPRDSNSVLHANYFRTHVLEKKKRHNSEKEKVVFQTSTNHICIKVKKDNGDRHDDACQESTVKGLVVATGTEENGAVNSTCSKFSSLQPSRTSQLYSNQEKSLVPDEKTESNSNSTRKTKNIKSICSGGNITVMVHNNEKSSTIDTCDTDGEGTSSNFMSTDTFCRKKRKSSLDDNFQRTSTSEEDDFLIEQRGDTRRRTVQMRNRLKSQRYRDKKKIECDMLRSSTHELHKQLLKTYTALKTKLADNGSEKSKSQVYIYMSFLNFSKPIVYIHACSVYLLIISSTT